MQASFAFKTSKARFLVNVLDCLLSEEVLLNLVAFQSAERWSKEILIMVSQAPLGPEGEEFYLGGMILVSLAFPPRNKMCE